MPSGKYHVFYYHIKLHWCRINFQYVTDTLQYVRIRCRTAKGSRNCVHDYTLCMSYRILHVYVRHKLDKNASAGHTLLYATCSTSYVTPGITCD